MGEAHGFLLHPILGEWAAVSGLAILLASFRGICCWHPRTLFKSCFPPSGLSRTLIFTLTREKVAKRDNEAGGRTEEGRTMEER